MKKCTFTQFLHEVLVFFHQLMKYIPTPHREKSKHYGKQGVIEERPDTKSHVYMRTTLIESRVFKIKKKNMDTKGNNICSGKIIFSYLVFLY